MTAQSPSIYTTEEMQNSLERIVEAEQRHHGQLANLEVSGAGTNIDIKYHRFDWTVNPTVRYISGSVLTYFKTLQMVSNISFDLDNTAMKVDSVLYHRSRMTFNQLNNIVEITLNAPISSNILDSITVYYAGVPPTSGFGSYTQRMRQSGGASVGETWTLSEPYGSRDWWPGKSDLQDKIDSIDIYVTCPSVNRVGSNGLLVEEINVGASNKLFHWKHRYPIANYLVAIAVTNYVQYIDKAPLSRGDTVNILNYVYPESLVESQQGSWKVANAMRLFDSLIAPYPFKKEKYGHAQFGWGGGQEHQTMTFAINLTDIGLASHELGHQWFGDKITCGSWQDIWLNESWATYMTGLYFQYVEPTYWINWRRNSLSSATSRTDGSVFVDDTLSVNRIFNGALSYNKGARVLHNLRFKLGDSLFFAGVRRYNGDPMVAYGFARQSDFKRNMEAASGVDLTEFFNDYYFGQGYPSFDVTICNLSGAVTGSIKQTQSHPSVSFFETPVPVKLINKASNRDTIIVINLIQNNQSLGSINLPPNFGRVDSVVVDSELWLLSKNNKATASFCLPTQDVDNQWISSVFPNPTEGVLNVRFQSDKMQNVTLEVLNDIGQIVLKNNMTVSVGDNSTALNIAALGRGIYILKISTTDKIGIKKIVKL